MEAGSVLRAGPAAGHIVVTHTVCELVSMEMGQKALLHTKADLAVLSGEGEFGVATPPCPSCPICPLDGSPSTGSP